MTTRSRARRASAISITAVLAAGGTALATPSAFGAATAAVSDTGARHASSPTGYRYVPVAPRIRPDGVRTATTSTEAAGLSEDGLVAGTSQGATHAVFTGDGRRGRWLTAARPVGADQPFATAVSPDGRVAISYIGPEGRAYRWDRDGRIRALVGGDTSKFIRATAVNRGGAVAGTSSSTRTCSALQVFDVSGRLSAVTPPFTSNCTIGGLSDGGLAVGTLSHTLGPEPEPLPRAIAVTGGRLVELKGTQGTRSAADAISPDGRQIIGRIGVVENGPQPRVGTVVRLSRTRGPVPLRDAGGLLPADVNGRGQVVGTVAGRAKLWSDGRLVDLTTAIRGLPRTWFVSAVSGINERGEIAATLTDPNPAGARNHAVKLTPARR